MQQQQQRHEAVQRAVMTWVQGECSGAVGHGQRQHLTDCVWGCVFGLLPAQQGEYGGGEGQGRCDIDELCEGQWEFGTIGYVGSYWW